MDARRLQRRRFLAQIRPLFMNLPLLAGRPAPEWPSPRPRARGKTPLLAYEGPAHCRWRPAGVRPPDRRPERGRLSAPEPGNSPRRSLLSPPLLHSQPPRRSQPRRRCHRSSSLRRPASVTLSCSSGKRRQTVTLTNKGQDTAQWTASLEGPQISVTSFRRNA